MLASFGLTLLAAGVGAGLATLVKLPAAPLLGAMVGVALVRLTSDRTFEIPSSASWVVYAVVGWLLGQTVTRASLASLRTQWLPIVLVVVLFIVFGLALAWALWRFGGLDVHTALLATAPGGIAQIGVLSAEAKANVPLILSVHVLRITSVIVLMSVGLKYIGAR